MEQGFVTKVQFDSVVRYIKKLIDNAAAGGGGSSDGLVPIGGILAVLGGYFTNGENDGYTDTLWGGNSVADANGYLNDIFYVCDGAALNDAASPIYNGAGRYLPNLDDDRFLMGNTAVGNVGGSNTQAHTHPVGTYTVDNENVHTHTTPNHTHTLPNHRHTIAHYHNTCAGRSTNWQFQSAAYGTTSGTFWHATITQGQATVSRAYARTSNTTTANSGYYQGTLGNANPTTNAGSAHNHGLAGSSGAASNDENRPLYLTVFFAQRIK